MWRLFKSHALQLKLYYLSNNFTQVPLILTASIKCYKNAPQMHSDCKHQKKMPWNHWAHVTGNEKQYVLGFRVNRIRSFSMAVTYKNFRAGPRVVAAAAAAAARLCQSCPTLCDPIDRSPTGSSVNSKKSNAWIRQILMYQMKQCGLKHLPITWAFWFQYTEGLRI